MRANNAWVVAALAAATLGLAGCASPVEATEAPERAVKIAPVPGTDLNTVTLTSKAMSRLGLKTEAVRPAPAGAVGVVSYSAVLYDAEGVAYVYITPGPGSFVRSPIEVDRVVGDQAYLKNGPRVGTTVVTVGVPELFGAEYGVGGE